MTAETAMPTVGTTAATLDFLAADFRVDAPAVREAARRHWYATTPVGPAVLRYEDCAAMLRDKRFRQAGVDHLAEQGITDGPLADMWRDIILNIEGDRHGRLRRLVSQAFTPQAVDGLRPRMREIVHGLVDTFAPAGECEFMAACADRYPPRVMFDLLGIPAEDQAQFVEWGGTLALILGYSVPQHAAAIDAARSDLYAATDWLCASRRLRPGGDLISRLVAAAADGDRLTTQELRSMIVALVVGGQDSTRSQLGSAMILFARHPDQWALLARRPDLAARATEEVMRLAPAAPFVWRKAVEDVAWRDLTIPAGTRVWLMVAAAHTDEATFGPDATRFDITAERPPQLAFGHGVHYCLGAALARAEIAEALAVLAARLPCLELTSPPEFRPDISAFTGPTSLALRFASTGRACQ